MKYLFQAGKAGVFYSADKCFETGADPRNIFDKQILKIWTPCLLAFYWMIPRATLGRVWKLAPSQEFRNQLERGQKTIGSYLKTDPTDQSSIGLQKTILTPTVRDICTMPCENPVNHEWSTCTKPAKWNTHLDIWCLSYKHLTLYQVPTA